MATTSSQRRRGLVGSAIGLAVIASLALMRWLSARNRAEGRSDSGIVDAALGGRLHEIPAAPAAAGMPAGPGTIALSSSANPGTALALPRATAVSVHLDPILIRRQLTAWAVLPSTWLLVLSLVAGCYAWLEFLGQHTDWSVVLIWLAGLVVFFLALSDPRTWRIEATGIEWLLFAVAVGVGVFLRFYHLDDIPYGLNNDSSYSGNVALNMWHSGHYWPWSPDATQGETFFDYWIVALFSVVGPTALAIKGAAAAAGSLTLIGMFLFTRRLLGVQMAALSTFMLGTAGWHVVFSRSGWRVITLPLVETFALYFLFRAIETRKRGSFALAGALLALQIDTYPAGRIVPVLALVWALVELARGPDRLTLIRGYAVSAVSFLLAGASVLAFALTNRDAFNARYDSVNTLSRLMAGDWAFLWQHIKYTVGIFTVRANGNDFFLEQPLLDQPFRTLFLLGLVLAIWLAVVERSRPYTFVLLGLALTLLPPFVSEWPNGNRGAATMPFVFILTALPISSALDLMDQYARKVADPLRRLPLVPVVAFLLFILHSTYDTYLGPNRQFVFGFAPQVVATGYLIRHLDERYDVHIIDNQVFAINVLAYLTYRVGDPPPDLSVGGNPTRLLHAADVGETTPPRVKLDGTRGLALIMPPEDTNKATAALAMYPGAKEGFLMYRDGLVFSAACLVVLVPPPHGSVAADIAYVEAQAQ